MDKLISLIFESDKITDHKRFFLESLLLLSLVIILITDYFFSIIGKLRILIGETNISYIVTALEVVFCCLITLLAIATIVAIVFLILYIILDKIGDKINFNDDILERVDYFHRGFFGSKHRVAYAFDWLLIVIILLYLFDKNYVINWKNNTPLLLYYLFLIVSIGRIMTSSLIGIINRFFYLHPIVLVPKDK